MSSLLLKRWRLIIGEVPSFNPSTQLNHGSESKPDSKSNLELKKHSAEAHYKQNIANRPYREKADWQFSKTEYQK